MKLKVTFTFSERGENAVKEVYEKKEQIEKDFALVLADLFQKDGIIHAFKTIETEVEE